VRPRRGFVSTSATPLDETSAGATGNAGRRGSLLRLLPGDAGFGIIPLRDVNEFRQRVDLVRIDCRPGNCGRPLDLRLKPRILGNWPRLIRRWRSLLRAQRKDQRRNENSNTPHAYESIHSCDW